MKNMNVTETEMNNAQEIIDSICEGINNMLVNAKASFNTRTVSKEEFYKRTKKVFEANYRELRKKHEANNDLVCLFALNVIQTMLLDNVKNQDLHEVTRYVGVVTQDGKVDFYCEFN